MITRDIETLDYYIILVLITVCIIAIIVALIKNSKDSIRQNIKRILLIVVIPFLLGIAFMSAVIFCLKDYF